MRVNGDRELVRRAFEQTGKPGLGDQLGRVRSDDVDAQQIVGFGVGDHFGEAVGVSFDRRFRVL